MTSQKGDAQKSDAQKGAASKGNVSKSTVAATRRMARHYTMQALYQWKMAGSTINAIEAEFRVDNDMTNVDVEYFHEILHGVPEHLSDLEAAFEYAASAARRLAGETLKEQGRIPLSHRIDIEDERHEIVSTVFIRDW